MHKIRVIARPGDPIVITRGADIWFAIIWAIYGLWGISSVIEGLPSISDSKGVIYNIGWSGSISFFAFGACFSCISLFFQLPWSRVTKKWIEVGFCTAIACFVAVYPITLFTKFLLEGTGLPSTVLTTIFVALPLMRIHLLFRRIRLI